MTQQYIEAIRASWAPLREHRHVLGSLLEHDLKRSDPGRFAPLARSVPGVGHQLVAQIHRSVIAVGDNSGVRGATAVDESQPDQVLAATSSEREWLSQHVLNLLAELLDDAFDVGTRQAWKQMLTHVLLGTPPSREH